MRLMSLPPSPLPLIASDVIFSLIMIITLHAMPPTLRMMLLAFDYYHDAFR